MKLSAAWTCQPARAAGCGGYRHFALLGQRGRGRERTVELQAVLDPGYRLLVPQRELHDRAAWLPGWQRLPPDGEPSVNFGISTVDL
ncbi:TIGR02450 family Trp-rich protein [Aphanothece minutissima]|uniref:TIGR02450 family Trp-rich protein n=1 Tax=Aphanothece cf. minutissima CCALA 015 TaxID=2107695 RepID=A0ABX5F6Y7_9CHRO|nr:TIGR02450 family Trp-rich protein [Aphanothece minutissima]PSB37325.1 TIGR02450 family Trp-rich protein [Aphanothece cf. minutissima CCALA 015]